MHDDEYAARRFGKSSSMAPMVLPQVEGEHRRILYTITEYTPLLDSSNMTFQDWVKIAQDIKVSLIISILRNFSQLSFSSH